MENKGKMKKKDFILLWGFIFIIFGLIGLIQIGFMESLFSIIIPSVLFIAIGFIMLGYLILLERK